ncbi:MAG: Ig-like domain-containing protein [Candidatus Symbiothrix sp.]|nr:Ig-like domain-containing protein [Candidatus Symbiothrix sp.]
MRKIIFLMLTFIGLSAASMNAQVLIGGSTTDEPNSSAILELRSSDLGLLLPRIALQSDTDEETILNPVEGLMVYATGTTGLAPGLYVWDGSLWGLVKGAVGTNPVTEITVTAEGSATSVIRGNTLQLSAALTPEDASNPHIEWSIGSGIGKATVNATGLVTGLYVGKVIILASASNGVFAEYELQVTNSGQTVTEYINEHPYLTYNFDGIVWMVENLKEVPANEEGYKTTYNVDGTADLNVNEGNPAIPGERGYYYHSSAPATICPAPWRIPSTDDYHALRASLLASDAVTQSEFAMFTSDIYFAGRNYADSWRNWGSHLILRSGSLSTATITRTEMSYAGEPSAITYASVRCVKPEN